MTPDEVRFAADGMLRSLATWLRILGYDCLAGAGLTGRKFLELAAAEDRIFLTRNTHLALNLPEALVHRITTLYILPVHLPGQLQQVVRMFALDPVSFTFTRCVACNLPLQNVTCSIVAGCVPPDVLSHETVFWRCDQCGRTFWRGSHVTTSLIRLQHWLAPVIHQ